MVPADKGVIDESKEEIPAIGHCARCGCRGNGFVRHETLARTRR
jgi:hypothetical protein